MIFKTPSQVLTGWEALVARLHLPLNLSAFVVGRSWCICAAVDLDEEALFSQFTTIHFFSAKW
jgi:hypothetical protein